MEREPGHLVSCLRPWGAFKHLIFINDAHANDVGIVACLGNSSEEGKWIKVSLGEESLTFPLASDMDDTSLVGMSLDVSATNRLLGAAQSNGEDPVVPPAPILYMMTNDTVVVAFHIVDEEGGQYPGMVGLGDEGTNIRGDIKQGVNVSTEQSQAPNSMEAERPPQGPTQTVSAFGASVPAAPAFGQTGFGFGATTAPKFGSTGFGSGPSEYKDMYR